MKYIISFLSFLLIIGIIFFYLQISKPEVIMKHNKLINKKTILPQKIFKINNPKIYNLPVRVLYMKIGFNKFKYKIIYKVIINKVDKFAFFNIKTILDNENISYSLIRAKKTEIYIFFKNLNEANSVINLFKEYNFNIKIQKLKQRI